MKLIVAKHALPHGKVTYLQIKWKCILIYLFPSSQINNTILLPQFCGWLTSIWHHKSTIFWTCERLARGSKNACAALSDCVPVSRTQMWLSVTAWGYKRRSWKAVIWLWYEIYRNFSKRCHECWRVLYNSYTRHLWTCKKRRNLNTRWMGRCQERLCSKCCTFVRRSCKAQKTVRLLNL